jgi:hypothetical protein
VVERRSFTQAANDIGLPRSTATQVIHQLERRRGNAVRSRACTRPLSRPGELANAWREAGLVNVVQDMRTIRMDFADFTDFWTPAEGGEGPVAEFVCSLDGAARSKLRDAVRSAYLDGEADGLRSLCRDCLAGERRSALGLRSPRSQEAALIP